MPLLPWWPCMLVVRYGSWMKWTLQFLACTSASWGATETIWRSTQLYGPGIITQTTFVQWFIRWRAYAFWSGRQTRTDSSGVYARSVAFWSGQGYSSVLAAKPCVHFIFQDMVARKLYPIRKFWLAEIWLLLLRLICCKRNCFFTKSATEVVLKNNLIIVSSFGYAIATWGIRKEAQCLKENWWLPY